MLRQMLLSRLAPDTVVWGAKLRSFEERPADAVKGGGGGMVTLQFEGDEPAVEAAALVGADGVHSLVRQGRATTPAEPPRYMGVFIAVG